MILNINSKTIEEVVASHVELQQYGINYLKGLCPFHGEKTPSFFVSIQKQTFKCFGCGKFGNKWQFAKEIGDVSYTEKKEREENNTIFTIKKNIDTTEEMKLMHSFSKNCIYSSLFAKAKNYLLSRGLDGNTIINSKLGFIPEGVNIPREVWKLKNRVNNIIFPIYDIKNELISFSARSINEKQYIHSTGFKTMENIFFLPYIFESTDKKKEVLISEGFFDVLTPAVYKIPSIGIFGCKISEKQINLIDSLLEKNKIDKENLVLAFDNDSAGLICTMEVFEKLKKQSTKILDWSKYENEKKDVSDIFNHYSSKDSETTIQKCEIFQFFFYAFEKSEQFRNYIEKNIDKLHFFKEMLYKREIKIMLAREILRNDKLFSLIFAKNIKVFEPILLACVCLDLWKKKLDKLSLSISMANEYLYEKKKKYFPFVEKTSEIGFILDKNELPKELKNLEEEMDRIEEFFHRELINFDK